jgi:aryl-alcohol dehydrogenase-like predicted oxidoreductase
MFPAVTCAIPGAKRPQQAEENILAANLPPLNKNIMDSIEKLYNQSVRPQVHHYW